MINKHAYARRHTRVGQPPLSRERVADTLSTYAHTRRTRTTGVRRSESTCQAPDRRTVQNSIGEYAEAPECAPSASVFSPFHEVEKGVIGRVGNARAHGYSPLPAEHFPAGVVNVPWHYLPEQLTSLTVRSRTMCHGGDDDQGKSRSEAMVKSSQSLESAITHAPALAFQRGV